MTIHLSPVSDLSDVQNVALNPRRDRVAYLNDLLHSRLTPDPALSGLSEIRDRAAASLDSLAIPSTRDEEWRFTDLSPLLQHAFRPIASSTSVGDIGAFILPEAAQSRLVFVNGIYAPELSAVANLPEGLLVGNLATVAAQQPAITNYLATQPGANEVFTALNTASLLDAAVVWVPKHQSVVPPIHLLFLSTASDVPTLNHPRCLVVVEPGSKLTLIEEYAGLGQGAAYFTNPVTELWIEATAQVNHTRIQRDRSAAFHIGKTAVSQARDSSYTSHAISLGAKLARHHLEVYQTGEQTQTVLNGLTMIADEQVADTHSTIALSKPYGITNQIHKCIVNDRAHAVFNGKITVPKAAQQTNAAQLSRNLLLSPKARVDTKPQLEITADNVKCAHGATVSQLDSEEVFYLQSRGLDDISARKLLVYAFAIDLTENVPVASLRDRLASLIQAYQG